MHKFVVRSRSRENTANLLYINTNKTVKQWYILTPQSRNEGKPAHIEKRSGFSYLLLRAQSAYTLRTNILWLFVPFQKLNGPEKWMCARCKMNTERKNFNT